MAKFLATDFPRTAREEEFTDERIIEHPGDVLLFCPHMEANKSTYTPVPDRELFLRNVKRSSFIPKGRVEGSTMLITLLPRQVARLSKK